LYRGVHEPEQRARLNVVMIRMRTTSLLVALAVGLSLATTLDVRPAYACSCAGSGSTEEAFRTADAVFAGEVVDIGELTTGREGVTNQMMPYLAP
jgi:hypothetical protein